MKVPWLSKERISAYTSDVLRNYCNLTGNEITPPIPVEDIIERYLGLTLSFENLEEKLGMKNILGATYIKKREISINTSMLDDKTEGRMLYTCAHEVGHWELHRDFIDEANRFGPNQQAIICRTRSAREPIEWQADYYASCLLMPEDFVRKTFYEVCGTDVMVIENSHRSIHGSSVYIEPCVQNWHFIADLIRETGGFTNVSKQAVIYRLQDLGLMINASGSKIGWTASCYN